MYIVIGENISLSINNTAVNAGRRFVILSACTVKGRQENSITKTFHKRYSNFKLFSVLVITEFKLAIKDNQFYEPFVLKQW